MANSNSVQSINQHSLPKSLLMHVFPGALVTVVFIILKPLFEPSGYPPLLSFLLAILLVNLPFMLGVLLNEGKKLNGRFSLEGAGQYREKVSLSTFVLVFIGTFVVVFLLISVATPISTMLADGFFSWLPDWFFFEEQTQYDAYAKNILVTVFTLHLIITSVALPWVEELYFRGYLMPRISRYGIWAPLLGGLFFGLYHVW